jgi:hypothetical protein
MAVKQIVDEALHTPMTRKEFLGQIGALFLAVIGVGAIIHSLHGSRIDRTNSIQGLVDSYGGSAYGGE